MRRRPCLWLSSYMKELILGKEGTVGLITYMRTDSTRISPIAQEEAKDFIFSKYGACLLSGNTTPIHEEKC